MQPLRIYKLFLLIQFIDIDVMLFLLLSPIESRISSSPPEFKGSYASSYDMYAYMHASIYVYMFACMCVCMHV